MQAKRIKWEELKLAIEHWRIVFLDESGVNIGLDTQVRTSHRESAGAWQRTAECADKSNCSEGTVFLL